MGYFGYTRSLFVPSGAAVVFGIWMLIFQSYLWRCDQSHDPHTCVEKYRAVHNAMLEDVLDLVRLGFDFWFSILRTAHQIAMPNHTMPTPWYKSSIGNKHSNASFSNDTCENDTFYCNTCHIRSVLHHIFLALLKVTTKFTVGYVNPDYGHYMEDMTVSLFEKNVAPLLVCH